LRERHERVAGADQSRHIGDPLRRVRPDTQKRVVGRAQARAAFQSQEPRLDEGLDERGAIRLASDESVPVERDDDRQQFGRHRVGRDVGDEAGDESVKRLAAARPQMRHCVVGGLGHGGGHTLVILGAKDSVAARLLRLVKALQRHLQQRQGVAAPRVGDEAVNERRIAFAERERQLAGGDGARDDLLEFRRGRRGEVEGRAPGAKGEQRRAGLEARVSVGAHDHDDVRKRLQKRRKGVGVLRRLGEQPLGLVDADEEPCGARCR
jgi:hypothetical protein